MAGMTRKPRKISKRSSIGKRQKLFKKKTGVIYTFEHGFTVEDDYCAYFGHCSHPTRATYLTAMLALVKKYAASQQRINQADVYTALAAGVAGDIYRLEFKDESGTAQNISYSAGATDNIYTIAEALTTAVYGGVQPQWMLQMFLFLPAVTSVYPRWLLNVSKTTVVSHSKSTLKYQNRTTEAVEGEEAKDVVDNVPLNGKVYAGPGSQLFPRVEIDDLQKFKHDGRSGLCSVTSFSENYKEPPLPKMMGVSKYAPVRINPGSLQTSTLEKTSYLFLPTLHKTVMIQPSGLSNNAGRYHGAGKVRIFALEKMIETQSIVSRTAIEIGLEVNLEMTVALKVKRPYLISRVFEENHGAPIVT